MANPARRLGWLEPSGFGGRMKGETVPSRGHCGTRVARKLVLRIVWEAGTTGLRLCSPHVDVLGSDFLPLSACIFFPDR